jgi:hypothetical protein
MTGIGKRTIFIGPAAQVILVMVLTLLGPGQPSAQASLPRSQSAAASTSPSTSTNRCPVVVDRVSAAHADPSTRRLLRDRVEEEVSKLDFGPPPYNKRYLLSAAVLTLSRTVEKDAEKTTCVVGLALRDGNENLLASIQGTATAEAGRGIATSADAVRAAAHSAVSRVVAAVRASEHKSGTH